MPDVVQLKDLRQSDDSDVDRVSSKDVITETVEAGIAQEPVPYRLYRWRWIGLFGMFCLNGVGGMVQPWFGPIANNLSADFHISLTRVNWLMNIVVLTYLPVASATPLLVARFGLRKVCYMGALALIVSAWVRFAATPKSLSVNGAYAIFFIAQMIGGFAQAVYQVIIPKYSENWFDLKSRTTATMIMAISNPLGGAIGTIISPEIGDTRQSILVLGIITSVACVTTVLVKNSPPTPPTYSGGQPSQTLKSLVHALLGKQTTPQAYMTPRERIDFAILALVFAALVTATNVFSILNAQYIQPYGYSSDIAGFMGATLLIVGLIAAFITAPLFDRVMTHHLGITIKILCPIVGTGWFSLIWAITPNDTAGLFIIMAVIGACSVTILPVGLEMGCELTRNAEGSSAIMWFTANALSFVFLLVEDAMRAGKDANPPLNMHKAIIFNGVIVFAFSLSVLLFRGKQARRAMDEERNRDAGLR